MAAPLPPQPKRPVHEGSPRDCHRRDGRGERLLRLRQRQRRLAQVHWLPQTEPLPLLQSLALQVRSLLAEAGIAWPAARAEVEGETWLR